MKNIYKSFRNKLNTLTIGQKLSIIVIFVVLIPSLLLSFFFAGHIYDVTLTQTIQEKQTEISEIEPMINNEISEILAHSVRIKTQSFYHSVFSYSGQELSPTLLESDDALAFFRDVEDILQEQFLENVCVYIELPGNDPIFSSNRAKDILLPMEHVRGSYWHGIFEGSHCNELFCPSFYLTGWGKNNLGDLAYIIPATCVRDGETVSCYLALYYSTEILKDILANVSDEDGTVSYLITDRDATVTSTDGNLSGVYHFSHADIYEYLFSSNNYMEKEVLGKTVYLSFKTIKRPNWFLINVVPETIVMQETRKTILRYFFIIALVLIASMFMALRLSSSLANRISSVVNTMSKTREGNLVPMEEPKIRDEIGNLISTYNYMTYRQKALTENLQKTADELRIAEVNALQAQINPHFLYNTLDTIQWMAMAGKEEEISTTVQKLTRFYKLTLGKDMTNTTVEKEIEHASIYVDLQNLRFDNAIKFIVDIPEDLKPLPIPRLTLQPIVENAILHGIREKESQQGCIVITGWAEDRDICLLISDDGVGIEEGFLPKILSKEGINPSTTGTNIAIYNVHHRLQLLYGADYGLSYESTLGEGTEVMIRFPKFWSDGSDRAVNKNTTDGRLI